MDLSSTSCGLLLKTRSSWTWRSAENRLQFTSNAKNGLRLELAPPEAGYASSLSNAFSRGLSEPSGLKFNWTAFLASPSPTGPKKVDGGCKRRLFSAETPSPTGGQKQRVVNSCGLVPTFSIFHMIGALMRNVLSARTVLLPPACLLLFSDQLDCLVTRSVTIGILI